MVQQPHRPIPPLQRCRAAEVARHSSRTQKAFRAQDFNVLTAVALLPGLRDAPLPDGAAPGSRPSPGSHRSRASPGGSAGRLHSARWEQGPGLPGAQHPTETPEPFLAARRRNVTRRMAALVTARAPGKPPGAGQERALGCGSGRNQTLPAGNHTPLGK